MTAEQHPTVLTRYGYSNESLTAQLTNNIIVNGRTDRGVVDDQFRYPWSGFEITQLTDDASKTRVTFDEDSHPTDDEVAGWTLTLGGGVELPFSTATHPQVGTDTLANAFEFSHTPGWADGQQVVVSIRTEDVQNRYGLVALSARRSTKSDGNNIVYGKTHYTYPRQPGPGISYARGDGKFGPGALWELQNLRVTTDKTGDTDPVWITATFRAPNEGISWRGYWEGQFDDFHTLFLRWIYHDGGVGRGEATYTLPLRTAATEGGIRRSRSAHEVTFTWVRTYKEFQRRHLDLANHSDLFADMLAPPKPATRLTSFQNSDDFSEQGVYDPAPTVTSVGFTSDPGSDRVYGPGDTIEVTVIFDQDVTVGYVNSKQDAAKLDLEVGGQTRTAHYARTDGNKVIFEYTVRPGDEAPSYLLLRHNSLRLYRDTPSEDGSIRNSSGGDAVLDHYGIADTGHRVDTVGPEFANAQVSSDGAQVAVTFNESIRSPAILRWFGVQTSLLQSLALDVRVDGEIAVRSDAAVSGDTVTLTVSEPITQGQTVTVSYDNLFIETGESIFEDLRGNSLLPFAEQPATNGSAVADVDRPGGGLALSRNDLLIREGQSGTYTVALTSQAAADVTVAIGDHPAGRATVSPASLTFTAHNWNTPQTVTITSAEDSDYVDRWVLLQHVATGDNYGASAAAWLILRDGYNLTTTTPNTPATGSPTISGTPQVGQTLTLDKSEIADADGLTNASYTYLYQWLRNDAEIAGQTASTYTLASADKGQTIKVKVSFLDDVNNQESRTSAETEPVAAKPNTEATGEPTISGTPQVGETLSADVSGIGDADGLTNVSYRYQWVAGGSDISEATGSSYLLTAGEQGQTIQVKVTFTDDADNQESLTSAETLAVAAKPNTAATGEPTISGTPQVDETLTADTSAISDEDGLANVSYQYQWLREDAEIAGQTNSTYELVSADEGKTIKVRVTFNDDAGNAESLTSTATTAVAAQPAETPVDLLSASFANVPADHDGSNFTFDLNFSENVNAGYARIQDHAFTVSGGAIASASRKTQGSNQGWTVEVDPAGNGAVSITLPETTGCSDSGAICTGDERMLSHATSVRVAGPPAISVSDAAVQEAEGAVLAFSVTLSHPSSRTVTVGYATSDNTAQAGSDYTEASGTLTFNPGDTSKTIEVAVLTDSEDESQETLTLTLSNPSQATLDDATGAGAIENGESSSGIQEDPPVVLLTATFSNMPTTHNGSAFTFDLSFSENVKAGYARIRDHAFTISGGAIASARRITQGSNQGWNVEVNPTGNGSVTITLPETTDCDAARAICTDDERKLSHATSEIVAGPPAISVSDANVQEAEGAVLEFSVTLSHLSSRTVTVAYATSDGSAQAGSDYTAKTGTLTFNTGDTSQTVSVTVLTDTDDEGQETLTLTISNPSQATLDDASGIGTIENGESTVPQDDPPAEDPVVLVTASFANMPADHNGSNFTFQLNFSENVDAGYARIQDDAFTVSGGSIASASRITQGSNQGWNVEVNPTGNGAVSITLPETTDCSDSGAICTDDSRKLSHPTSATVAGPPAISISDATVQEAEGAVLVFTATLSHASSRTVTVDYATSDGTAVAGSDYTAASGKLTFNAGQTSHTVQVTVLTDSEDESQETLTLTLSNPSQATLADATGTGTIEDGESSSGTQEDPPVVLLTATFSNMPTTHNGSAFTFDLSFSENVKAGYARIRDHAFTISGGAIASARRITQGSTQGWTVEVDPTGNGAVSITLPETTNCDDNRAICTEDGRMLSNRLVVTVSGPGG